MLTDEADGFLHLDCVVVVHLGVTVYHNNASTPHNGGPRRLCVMHVYLLL